MIITQIKELLRQLRSGTLDVANATSLERLSSVDLTSDLREAYPLVFQERHIRKKHEMGMVHSTSLETTVHQVPNSLFPTLSKCVFISSYNDSLSEITRISHIQEKDLFRNRLSAQHDDRDNNG